MSNVTIDRTIFKKNSANFSGGGLYFYCNDFGTDLSKCSLTIANSKFINNIAKEQGGAVKWNFYEPTMINVDFEENVAFIYGDNNASISH